MSPKTPYNSALAQASVSWSRGDFVPNKPYISWKDYRSQCRPAPVRRTLCAIIMLRVLALSIIVSVISCTDNRIESPTNEVMNSDSSVNLKDLDENSFGLFMDSLSPVQLPYKITPYNRNDSLDTYLRFEGYNTTHFENIEIYTFLEYDSAVVLLGDQPYYFTVDSAKHETSLLYYNIAQWRLLHKYPQFFLLEIYFINGGGTIYLVSVSASGQPISGIICGYTEGNVHFANYRESVVDSSLNIRIDNYSIQKPDVNEINKEIIVTEFATTQYYVNDKGEILKK